MTAIFILTESCDNAHGRCMAVIHPHNFHDLVKKCCSPPHTRSTGIVTTQ